MADALAGARLKIIRAQKHLDSLKDELARYTQSKPYGLTVENDRDVVGMVRPNWHITCDPDAYLGTIVGDCLCNLRSALDYVAWELASKHVGRPLVGPPSGKDRITFPIVSGANSFGDSRKVFARYKIPTSAIDEIESVQPYGGGYHPLWLLNLLVNSDKHRLPVLARGDVQGGHRRRSAIRRAQNNARTPRRSQFYRVGNQARRGHARSTVPLCSVAE